MPDTIEKVYYEIHYSTGDIKLVEEESLARRAFKAGITVIIVHSVKFRTGTSIVRTSVSTPMT
jgi:hypothetical protein